MTLAELYAGPRRGENIEEDMHRAGVAIFDLPVAAAAICGRAYRRYDSLAGDQAEAMGRACRRPIFLSARTRS